jgi:serine phosphatase RsbU (regulator of sigma subunit)
MPGLETRRDASAIELSAAVALTLPAPASQQIEDTRLLVKPPESPRADAGLDKSASQWPIAFMSREHFKKGEYLFKIGDPAEKLFYIGGGVVRLPELNRCINAGQVIGEMGIFSPCKERTASAIAEEDLEVFTMGREEVRRFMSRDPGMAIDLIQLSIKRFIENLKVETEARERINSELRIAREIQTTMLPRTFPPFPGRKEFEIYAMMEPAKEVGGDLYDFFFVAPNRLCILVGDVSGKGVPAALFMAISKTLLKSEAMRGYTASEILSRVNNLLCPDNPSCMFVTVFCVILNTDTGEVECCSGGHNRPLLCTADGRVEYLEVPPGFVLGFQENFTFESKRLQLKRGEMIFLYTDGVTEAQNSGSEFFSDNRLKACVSSVRNRELPQIIAGVQQEIAVHTQDEPQFDDITMLALKYRGV